MRDSFTTTGLYDEQIPESPSRCAVTLFFILFFPIVQTDAFNRLEIRLSLKRKDSYEREDVTTQRNDPIESYPGAR